MTAPLANPVSIADIDRLLASEVRPFAFPAGLESRFETDTGLARSHYLATSGAIALSLNVLFLMADYIVLPDVFKLAIFIRLGVVDVPGFAACAVVWRNPRPWLREALDAGTVVLAAAGFLALYLASRSPLVVHAHYALVLVLIFPTSSNGCAFLTPSPVRRRSLRYARLPSPTLNRCPARRPSSPS